MNILLQVPGAELATGLFGEAGRSDLNNPGSKDIILFIFIVAIIFLSTTESWKVLLRNNIGRKALSLRGIIAGSSLYMTWGLITGYFSFAFVMSAFRDEVPGSRFLWVIAGLYGLAGAIVIIYHAYIILNRGMNEYYLSKAIDSHDWQELEYRGDSVAIAPAFPEWTKEKIWFVGETKASLKTSLFLMLNPVIGIPALISAISFTINEWYHIHYKPRRIKESYLDMRIEMEKAGIYYNQTELSSKPGRVTTPE